jgi:transcriptional regulator with XRE-family HTH domain
LDIGLWYCCNVPPLPRLRQLREENALSQVELASRSGVTQAAISRIEGGASAQYETMRKLAQALEVKPQELMREP